MAEDIKANPSENESNAKEQSPTPIPLPRKKKQDVAELKESYIKGMASAKAEEEKAEEKKKPSNEKQLIKIKRWAFFALSLLLIFLEALPKGAVMIFSVPLSFGRIKSIERKCSYFNMELVQRGNYFPLILVVLSFGIIYYILKLIITDKPKPAKSARNFAYVGMVACIAMFIFSSENFNLVGGAILAILFVISFVFSACVSDSDKFKDIKLDNKTYERMMANNEDEGKGKKNKKEKKEKKPKKEKKEKKKK